MNLKLGSPLAINITQNIIKIKHILKKDKTILATDGTNKFNYIYMGFITCELAY